MALQIKKRPGIFENNHISFQEVKLSKQWFEEKVADLPRLTPNKVMQSNAGQHLTNYLVPGKLYMFFYMPKYKDDLPYYDLVPLVLPFARDNQHFTGLNLHYLDLVTRFRLFKELLKISNAKNLADDTKLKFSWSLISSVSKMAPAHACIKQYLFSHVKSAFLEIKPEDWATAALLPTHRFVGATDQQVWADSRRIAKIRK
jgi:hypothetical protein